MTKSKPRSRKSRRAPLPLLAAGGAAALVLIVPVGIAAAAKHHSTPVGVTFTGGCSGQGTSLRSNGKVLDKASAPQAPGATSSDPFHVARGGKIDWSGSTPVVFTNHHWWVHVDGFPVRSGGSVNASHEKSHAGVIKVDVDIPSWLGMTGVYYVNGKISGVGGTCVGSAYIQLTGDPATGALLWVGILAVLLGFGLLLGARPNWFSSFRAVPSGSVITTRPQPGAATTPPTEPPPRGWGR